MDHQIPDPGRGDRDHHGCFDHGPSAPADKDYDSKAESAQDSPHHLQSDSGLHSHEKSTESRRRSIFKRLLSARALSIVSVLIAAAALSGSAYVAYEDIKPTLIVAFDVQESDSYQRSEQFAIEITIANTGRRAARDVHISIDIANICDTNYSLRYIPPGSSAFPFPPYCEFEIPGAPLLEEHMNNQMDTFEWIKVDVEYNWDVLFFSIPYHTSEIIETDDHHSVNMWHH